MAALADDTSSLPEPKRTKYDGTSSASEPTTSTPNNPFVFSTGNVRLKARDPISKELVIGSVSSDAMVLASHVWKKFLFPPWEEGGSVSLAQKEIDCSEDDPVALLILLNIAHLQFRSIPATLSYEDLYNVAILCDQYDCIQLVQPWLEKWLQDETMRSLKEGTGWLFIAWVFGRDAVFETLAAHMVEEVQTNAEGQCLDKSGNPIPSNYMPPGILGKCTPHPVSILTLTPFLENILKIRLATIRKLLDSPYSQIQVYERVSKTADHSLFPNGTVCQMGNAPACDALVYGSLTISLFKVGLWPKKAAEDIYCSVETVAYMIRSVKVLGLPGYSDHTYCGKRNYAEYVLTILREMPNPILDSHKVHMKVQRGETLESTISR
jgi:hypothetical protein